VLQDTTSLRQSIIRESQSSVEENESVNELKPPDKTEAKELLVVKNDESIKSVDPNKQNLETVLKESTSPAGNHSHHKRQAPKPPPVISDKNTADSDSTEDNKASEQEKEIPPKIKVVNENIDSKADESEPEIINSKNDSENVANESRISSDLDEEQTNNRDSTNDSSSLGYEVTVSPNHRTIIKTLEDSNLDMSHVSIVTIDNNGKDVMIQTANEDTNSGNDILNLMTPYQNNTTNDEVVIVRNDEYPTSDKIVVNTEYMPSSDEISSPRDSKTLRNDFETNPDVVIHDADDSISIQTSSSDNSANQNDKPRIKVNLNLVSESEHDPYSDGGSVDTSEFSEIAKTRVDQVPNHKDSNNKQMDSNNKNNLPNGVFPSASPAVKSNASVLKRELSDSGSFFSVSSDKENNNESENKQNVIMRKRREKVSNLPQIYY
jgi:hypothetical protein